MIQLKTHKKGGFELTDRKRSVLMVGKTISVDEQIFNAPGEYEVDGIEVVYGTQAFLVVWEKLQIAYIFEAGKPGSFEKSQFTPCNVIILDEALPNLEKSHVNDVIETYDPSVVVMSAASLGDELKSSYKFEERDVLKLNDQTLPPEGRDFIALT